jgi:diguanylate cyclase (GGDEF)-like protein
MTDETKLDDEEGRLAALRRYDMLCANEEEQLGRIADLVRAVMDAPIAVISLIDVDTQWFMAARGIDVRNVPRDTAFCNETIKRSEPLAISDLAADPRFASSAWVTGSEHARSYLGVPLKTPDGYNVGALCAIDREPRQFDQRQAGILEKLAEIVVEQFELRQIAKQDPMTGALTRRGFFGEVEREFLRAGRYSRPSTLAVIDIDHFKSINDRYGHPAGDAVLTSIANTCTAQMRKSDVFGRIGGEEFGLLLPETDAEEAREAGERIRCAVEATIVEFAGASIRATVSVGIAPMPAIAEGSATWFSEADIALYEAKRFGRNRVVVGRPRRPAALTTDPAHQIARPH